MQYNPRADCIIVFFFPSSCILKRGRGSRFDLLLKRFQIRGLKIRLHGDLARGKTAQPGVLVNCRLAVGEVDAEGLVTRDV